MRLERVVVRVWVRSVKMGAPWRQLLELDVDLLGGLQWVGKSVCLPQKPCRSEG